MSNQLDTATTSPGRGLNPYHHEYTPTTLVTMFSNTYIRRRANQTSTSATLQLRLRGFFGHRPIFLRNVRKFLSFFGQCGQKIFKRYHEIANKFRKLFYLNLFKKLQTVTLFRPIRSLQCSWCTEEHCCTEET